MRLYSFRIQNFKSIKDTGECKVSEIDNVVVLAGQNESGKTSVLEALEFFANGPSEERFEKLQRRQELCPEVQVKFRLDDQDIENIFIESDENVALKKDLVGNPYLSLIATHPVEGEFENAFTEETLKRLEKFFIIPDADEEADPSENPEAEEPSKFGLDELYEFFSCEIRRFSFYDSFDDLLPGEVLISDIDKYPAIKDFEKVFGVNFKNIVTKSDPRAIQRAEQNLNAKAGDDLNKYWTQKLEEGGKYNFQVKIIKMDTVENSKIEFTIDREDNDPLFLEQKSRGFRWFSAFNLRLRALGMSKVKIENLVMLIDEPGQGLHETAQSDVKKIMVNIP